MFSTIFCTRSDFLDFTLQIFLSHHLSMHDYSRDIMLATAQEHIETRMLLSAAENKSKEMEEQLKKLEEITKKTDEILYQMIPKSVAERLRFDIEKYFYVDMEIR